MHKILIYFAFLAPVPLAGLAADKLEPDGEQYKLALAIPYVTNTCEAPFVKRVTSCSNCSSIHEACEIKCQKEYKADKGRYADCMENCFGIWDSCRRDCY